MYTYSPPVTTVTTHLVLQQLFILYRILALYFVALVTLMYMMYYRYYSSPLYHSDSFHDILFNFNILEVVQKPTHIRPHVELHANLINLIGPNVHSQFTAALLGCFQTGATLIAVPFEHSG